MSAKSKARQKQMVATLVAHQNQPTMLAHQLLVLAGEPNATVLVNENTTVRDVLAAVGNIMAAKRMLLIVVADWVERMVEAAGIVENPVETPEIPVETVGIGPETGEIAAETPFVPENVVPIPTAKRERAHRRVYIDPMVRMIETGEYTHEQILAAVLDQFPDLNRLTVNTVLVDFKNPKYSALKNRPVGVDEQGRLYFKQLALQA